MKLKNIYTTNKASINDNKMNNLLYNKTYKPKNEKKIIKVSIERKYLSNKSRNNANQRSVNQLKLKPPIVRYLSSDKSYVRPDQKKDQKQFKSKQLKRNKDENIKKTIKIFKENNKKIKKVQKIPKIQNQQNVKRKTKISIERTSSKPRYQEFQPKIIKRARTNISKDKIIKTDVSFTDLYNSKNILKYKTQQIDKLPLNSSEEGTDSLRYKSNSFNNNCKTQSSKFKFTSYENLNKYNSNVTSKNIYETPLRMNNSPKIESFNVKSMKSSKYIKKYTKDDPIGSSTSGNIYSSINHSDLVRNSSTREVSKPKIINNKSNFNFAKTLKISSKNNEKFQNNFINLSEIIFKKDIKKTIKKSDTKKKKKKPKFKNPFRIKKQEKKFKAKPKADFRKNLNARLKEMNNKRKINTKSIYDEYLKRTNKDMNKISLKTYYKIPKGCKDFKKNRLQLA